jgi:2-phosphosulfolactate phosphatase
MTPTIEVLFSPAEYAAGGARGFANTVCVVFDVLRATSVMVTGLANGAAGFLPVAEISEALALHRQQPETLLAGERDGLCIGARLTGGVEFAFGNSPREYTTARVAGKTIITTTTNGTRALRACATAEQVIVASFLNLQATADWITRCQPKHLVLVAAGTGDDTALEDVLAAGALCEGVALTLKHCELSDSAEIARRAYRDAAGDLSAAVRRAVNARRLLANAGLRDDVNDCLRRDAYPLIALLGHDGVVRTSP